MLRKFLPIFLIIFPTIAWTQIRLTKLVLRPKQVYELKGTDILVVDSLIMMDSSRLILNKFKPENFIHARVIKFGKGCLIDGGGIRGLDGRVGRPGLSTQAPCTDGKPGATGTEGTFGGAGVNVSIYFSEVVVNGTLTIDVSGGAGGKGGKGGSGGGGGPGTRLCRGGNGGQAGFGSNGGNGGNAGNVTLVAPRIPELRNMLGLSIIVRNYGGDFGEGGEPGAKGLAGLSALGNSKMDGSLGRKGERGKNGIAGKPGAVNFQDKQQ
jgi:hypothetical protein